MDTATKSTNDTPEDSTLRDAEALRHRWEMRMVWVCGVITVSCLILLVVLAAMPAAQYSAMLGMQESEVQEYLGLMLVFPAIVFLYRFKLAADIRAAAVLAGKNQFPDLYARFQALGDRMGVQPLPRLYVANGNGVINAYALSCNSRRKYVVVHAEIAHLLDSDPATVEFVLAHELAHHRLGHVSLFRSIVGAIPQILVLPGKSLVRAQEYSADRIAAKMCMHGIHGITLLAAGGSMYRKVNLAAYREQCEAETRAPSLRLVNWLASHPVMTKRYSALLQLQEKGFSSHGEMF